MKPESPTRLDTISPLTVNSDISLATSVKTPSTGSLKDYLKYDLFRNIEEDLGDKKIKKSKNVGQISETNPISKYPELHEKILEIAERDLDLISSCEPNQNKVRASLVCYQKDNFESLTEIKINPADISTEEVRKFIIEHEKASIRESLELRSQQLGYKILEQREDFMDKKSKFEEYKSMLPKLTSQIAIFDSNTQILESDNSEEIKKILKRNKIPHDDISDLESLKALMSDFYNQKIEQTLKKCAQIFPDEEALAIPETKDKLKHYRRLFSTFTEEAKKDEDYRSFLANYKNIEKEQKICERLLENPRTFEDVVIAERGHSEDYLYHTLLDSDSRAIITSQIPENADRFYFIVSSTRDSCDRCSDKMEQIAELFKGYFGRMEDKNVSADGDEMDCKLLYFANQPMSRRRDGSNYVREYNESLGNLSDTEEDVINIMPQIYCREDMLMFSDYTCYGLPDIEKKFSSDDSKEIIDGGIDDLDINVDEEIACITKTDSPKNNTKSRTGSPERLFDNTPLGRVSAKR